MVWIKALAMVDWDMGSLWSLLVGGPPTYPVAQHKWPPRGSDTPRISRRILPQLPPQRRKTCRIFGRAASTWSSLPDNCVCLLLHWRLVVFRLSVGSRGKMAKQQW